MWLNIINYSSGSGRDTSLPDLMADGAKNFLRGIHGPLDAVSVGLKQNESREHAGCEWRRINYGRPSPDMMMMMMKMDDTILIKLLKIFTCP